jgi:hypothetical protein
MEDRIVSIEDVPDLRHDSEKLFTPLSIFNHLKPDIGYAERVAEETIHICGAWVTVFARTDNEDFNKVWEEDPDPTYKAGVKLKAFFAPEPLGLELTKWGVDAPLQFQITFARSELLAIFGQARLVRSGDVIDIPYNAIGQVRIRKFRIVDSQDVGSYHYRWLYHRALIENIPDDKALRIDHN